VTSSDAESNNQRTGVDPAGARDVKRWGLKALLLLIGLIIVVAIIVALTRIGGDDDPSGGGNQGMAPAVAVSAGGG
jgi:hypothetical protein